MALDLIRGWQTFETEFHSVKVSMEVRPFRRKAMMAVRSFLGTEMPEIKDDMNSEEIGKLADKAFELQELAGRILPDHLRNIEGITVNRQPVSIDDLSEEPVFLPLTLEIITKIATISNIEREQEKNSGGLSGSMEEQAGTDQ